MGLLGVVVLYVVAVVLSCGHSAHSFQYASGLYIIDVVS